MKLKPSRLKLTDFVENPDGSKRLILFFQEEPIATGTIQNSIAIVSGRNEAYCSIALLRLKQLFPEYDWKMN